jgi:hypothetical protein
MASEVGKSTQPQSEEYAFARGGLPKSLSHPLKRSLLDAALHSSSVYEAVWYVLYAGRRFGNTVLDAHFYPENRTLNAASGKIQVTVWAVPAQERKVTEDLLMSEGLPILCAWIAKAQSKGNAWRGFGHRLSIERAGESLRCSEE